MIKNQNDVKQLLSNLRENENTLHYETETGIISIRYDKAVNEFLMNVESKIYKNIRSKDARCIDKVLVYQLWNDRKYINKGMV
jgi:uncharacterized protein YaaR (DUF327 family)